MDMENLIVSLVVGGVAGWLAGLIMKKGFGLVGNIIVGILGAIVGSYLFGALGIRIGSGIAAALVSAVAGAVVLLFVIGLIRK